MLLLKALLTLDVRAKRSRCTVCSAAGLRAGLYLPRVRAGRAAPTNRAPRRQKSPRMLELDAVGDKIVAWALVGSTVTNEPVKDWPLSSFSTAASIAGAYLAFVFVGSLLMRAYPGDGVKLYGVAFLYNIAQVMLCSYMCIEASIVARRSGPAAPSGKFERDGRPAAARHPSRGRRRSARRENGGDPPVARTAAVRPSDEGGDPPVARTGADASKESRTAVGRASVTSSGGLGRRAGTTSSATRSTRKRRPSRTCSGSSTRRRCWISWTPSSSSLGRSGSS